MPIKKQKESVSYYDVLHVRRETSDEDIKKAYHMLAKIFHPDHNPKDRHMAEHRFRLINEAYSHLKTRERRERYNRTLRSLLKTKATAAIPAENDNAQKQAIKGWFSGFLRSSGTSRVTGKN